MIRLQNKKSESKNRGQSLAEYSALIAVVAVALLAMQFYMKRGIQGVVKYSTDQFSNNLDYIKADPDDITTVHTDSHSVSDDEIRFMQEGATSSFKTTTITDMGTNTTGGATYWKVEEL